jgi:hypothetical protein
MMSTIETLLQEARLLPQLEQLKLAALLIQQAQSVVPIVEQRRAAFRRVRGKFKHLLPTVDEFMAEKRAELELEERKFEECFGKHAETSE